MSEYESTARVLLHEAADAVERDAVVAASRGSTAEPWTAELLTALALVNAVLAVAEECSRPGSGAPRKRSAPWRPRRMRT